MNKSNNVIDLKTRRRALSETAETAPAASPVLDMTERRNEMISQERRKVRRTILTEFIGAHIILPERGLQKVTIFDISEDGIAIDLDMSLGKFQMGEEISMRVYLNQFTFFPFVVRIANARAIPEEGVTRHGTNFVKGTVNDEALHHFVKFIETVSTSLRTDHGDVMVSGLRR